MIKFFPLLTAVAALCLLPASASAQDDDGAVLTEPLIELAQQPVDDQEADVSGPTPEVEADISPQQQLDRQRALIAEEMGLPPQADTGFDKQEGFGGLSWLPQVASAQGEEHDFMFNFILWVSVFFTVLVVTLMVWFLIRYRARSDDEPDPDPASVSTHSTTLEITWTVIPTCIVLVMFTLGFRAYLNDTIAPPNAYTVNVTAGSWYWNFGYPNGAITSDLHLEKDRPVRFVLRSTDVIHSLYIPAFRLKKDVVPGRLNQFWVEPSRAGVYEVFCTEYCGTGHAEMVAKAFVYEPEDYRPMLARISDIYTEFPSGEPRAPVEIGQTLWQARGCMGCHSIDGSSGTGPTWKDLYGKPDHLMADGEVLLVDDDYIREAIFYPSRRITAGYPNAMASYLGVLSEEDVQFVIAYMKTISEHVTPEVTAEPKATGGVITAEESTAVDDAE
jgi:cytochrome c oxidase subunit 2